MPFVRGFTWNRLGNIKPLKMNTWFMQKGEHGENAGST